MYNKDGSSRASNLHFFHSPPHLSRWEALPDVARIGEGFLCYAV